MIDEARINGIVAGLVMRSRLDGWIDRSHVEACLPQIDPTWAVEEPILANVARNQIRAWTDQIEDRFAAIQRASAERERVGERENETAIAFRAWHERTRCIYCDRFATIVQLFGAGGQYCAEHDPARPRDGEDLRPGFYYVTTRRDDGETRRVRGPYATHRAALDAVSDVAIEAAERDFRAHFYAWGTARSETDLGPGILGAAE